MKATVISQLLSTKSAKKKGLNNLPKEATETTAAGAVFSQFWNRLIRPENARAGLSPGKTKGEIEIPILRQKENKKIPGGEHSAGRVALKNSAQVNNVSVRSFMQTSESAETRASKSSSPVHSALVDEAPPEVQNSELKAMEQPETYPKEIAESARKIAHDILDALQKNGALTGLKKGDVARVKMEVSPETRAKPMQKQGNNNAQQKQAVKAQKAADTKLALTFKYAGKNGWQLKSNTPLTGKASVWQIRIVLSENTNPATPIDTALGNSKISKAPTDEIVPAKKLLVNLLSAKKTVEKGAAKGNSSAVRLKFTVQTDSEAPKAPAKTGQSFVLVSKGKEAQAVLKLTGGNTAEAQVNEQAQKNSSGKGRAMNTAQEESQPTQKSAGVANFKKVAGEKPAKLVQNEFAATGKELLKGNGEIFRPKAQGTSAARPSVLIERIESLLAQANRSKAGSNMKMQIQESPFGKMDIQLEQNENRLSVTVETSKAKEAFMRLVPLIQNNLAEKGYTLSGVHVSVGQFATQERKEGTPEKRRVKNLKTHQVNGKDGDDHDNNPPVINRKFGYNTLEVTA